MSDISTARHEVAHLCGLVAAMGNEPQYAGLHAVITHGEHGGEFGWCEAGGLERPLTKSLRDRATLASATAPCGLLAPSELLALVKSLPDRWSSAYGVMREKRLLSAADTTQAAKACLIKSTADPETLIGLCAWQAAQTVMPKRLAAIVDMVASDGGIELMPINDVVPRKQAAAVATEARRLARQLATLKGMADA